MSSRRALRFTSYAESRNAGPEAIEQLGAEIGELASAYIRVPISQIMGDLVAAQDTVFTLLEGRQRAADSVELYMLASVASGLLAKASHDLGKAHDAMTQARTMYVCADNADHLGLRVWSRGLQSLIAYWAGRPTEAVRYARAGTMIMSDDMRGTLAAWLPALEARALAHLGNVAEARLAIRKATAAREIVVEDELDRIGGLLTFPLAKQHYYVAGAYVALDGGHEEAADQAASALGLYEQLSEVERSFSDVAGARAELALARVHGGELDGAREALAPVLALDPERRIGGIVTSAERVHNALCEGAHVDSALAGELRDEIETFSNLPASALNR
jgi:tetratricopeptide (TPR) repeat protein